MSNATGLSMRRGRPWQASAARRLDTLQIVMKQRRCRWRHRDRRQRHIGCFEGPHPCPSVDTSQKGMTATRQKQSLSLRRRLNGASAGAGCTPAPGNSRVHPDAMGPAATPAPRLFSVGAESRYTSGIADAASPASAIGEHREARGHAWLSTPHKVSVSVPARRQDDARRRLSAPLPQTPRARRPAWPRSLPRRARWT